MSAVFLDMCPVNGSVISYSNGKVLNAENTYPHSFFLVCNSAFLEYHCRLGVVLPADVY